MPDFITARRFNTNEPFREFIQILDEHSIPYTTEIFNERINEVTVAAVSSEYVVKVPTDQYQKVYELFSGSAASQLDYVDPQHYLFDFSDEELYDLLAKPDEWSGFEYQLAQKILADRGKPVDPVFLSSLRKTQFQQAAQPEAETKTNIRLGYLFALLGGVAGIGIGWNLMYSKKRLSSGEEVYTYQMSDRRHGIRIFWIGLVMFIFLLYWRVVDRM